MTTSVPPGSERAAGIGRVAREARRRAGRLPAGTGAALTVVIVLLVLAGRYGPHGDELYFRMLPLAWWYEDQPPLTVWITHLMTTIDDALWVQRAPAAVAAAAGALLAARFPSVLGYGRRVQSIAAWAHATTVYPLIMGHVFLTGTLDLLAWQAAVLMVVLADRGDRRGLVWTGVIAGAACWNKLLILPLVGALVLSLLIVRRDLLLSRQAALGAALAVVIGAPQVMAQAFHGWPMRQVSGDLVALHGTLNRVLIVPLLVAFVGPPLVGVWRRGLFWSARGGSRVGLLLPAGVVLVLWNLVAPAQPYYAVGLFLTALSVGWGPISRTTSLAWRRAPAVLAANAVIAAVLALPVLPVTSPLYSAVSAINPVARDQVDWPGYVAQVDRARASPESAVITDSYALAGAVDFYRPSSGADGIDVASGHNALWRMGPPAAGEVLLVGDRAVSQRDRFASCTDAGALTQEASDPFGVAGSPMVSCSGPRGGWAAVWPSFRHLGG